MPSRSIDCAYMSSVRYLRTPLRTTSAGKRPGMVGRCGRDYMAIGIKDSRTSIPPMIPIRDWQRKSATHSFINPYQYSPHHDEPREDVSSEGGSAMEEAARRV